MSASREIWALLVWAGAAIGIALLLVLRSVDEIASEPLARLIF